MRLSYSRLSAASSPGPAYRSMSGSDWGGATRFGWSSRRDHRAVYRKLSPMLWRWLECPSAPAREQPGFAACTPQAQQAERRNSSRVESYCVEEFVSCGPVNSNVRASTRDIHLRDLSDVRSLPPMSRPKALQPLVEGRATAEGTRQFRKR